MADQDDDLMVIDETSDIEEVSESKSNGKHDSLQKASPTKKVGKVAAGSATSNAPW